MEFRRDITQHLPAFNAARHDGEKRGTEDALSARERLLLRAPDADADDSSLPPDLRAESVRRLRICALLYAFVFFVSDPLTSVFFPEDRAEYFASAARWLPSTLSMATGLGIAALTAISRVSLATRLEAGLYFEIAGSFGIAAAQYADGRYDDGPPWSGLSWVAVWILSFTIMVPTRPRAALTAALASASAVPIVVGLVMVTQGVPSAMTPQRFFFHLILPYLLVVLVAYVCARVMHCLGTELTHARELGSYRLIERLGSGGMGEVWRAEHRLLVRPAAVKLMRRELVDEAVGDRRSERHARFEREAQATSSLCSPHTVQLYDYGVADDGTFYYVMELLDGFDLQVLVDRFGPLPSERAVFLLKQVCHSLAEAHAAGLIHRDVKPANVYVCRYGRDVDFVKVLDFGLVKPRYHSGQTQIEITETHVARGTPAFMSPEQVMGTHSLDGRSDIYALGCLAYWLVTGALVFNGRTAMETLVQQTQARPVPPSRRAELEVPPALDDLILACLEKNPDARPPTVDSVAARLETIRMRREWTTRRAREWWDMARPLPGCLSAVPLVGLGVRPSLGDGAVSGDLPTN